MSLATVRRLTAERLAFVATIVILGISEFVTFKLSATLFARFHTGWTFSLPADLKCFVVHGAAALRPFYVVPPGIEPFMYPPPLLLLGAPLSLVPANIAYLLWSCLGVALLCVAGWQLKMRPILILGAVLLPPTVYCVLLGQTGLILSALFVLSLAWAPRSPVLSGCIAGLMILKPPAALLLPICYAASGQRSAFIAAIISGLCVCALTLLVFGMAPWVYFFTTSLSLARYVLQMPWHHAYQNLMVSPFILLRGFGWGLPASYAVQGAITLVACVLTWRLWRTSQAPGTNVLLVTACLAALATPYDYIYDLPAIGLLLAANFPYRGWQLSAALCFILGMGLYVFLSYNFVPIGAVLIAGLGLACWPDSAFPKRENSRRSRNGLFRLDSQT